MIMNNHPRGRGRVGTVMWAVIAWCIVIIIDYINAETMDECLQRVTACQNDRLLFRKRACGSDGHTYPNKCALIQAQCNRVPVTFVSEGSCSETKPCQKSYIYAQTLKKAGTPGFVPRCRNDGRYASVQCDAPDSGGDRCWCVTAQGLPVPGTTVHKGRPPCSRIYHGQPTNRRYSRGGLSRKLCSRSDRQIFNNHLIKNFRSDWQREPTTVVKQRSDSEIDRIVLDWKFLKLDNDSNDVLNESEYSGLNKIVRKFVKPKRCAKLFPKTCDLNRDQKITRPEWVDCLANNGMDDDRSGRIWNEGDKSNVAIDEDEDEDDDDDEESNFKQYGIIPEVLQSSGPSSNSPSGLTDDSLDTQNDGDCMTDRKAVLNEQQSSNLYVPECTSDGRYKKVQCYSDYCWCVNEDTGKNIPGTSLKNATPKCELVAVPSRPMKGCPESRKSQFLKDLVEFFQTKMTSHDESENVDSGNSTSNGWQDSKEEKIVSWSFAYLDKNKNKILERKEWKSFRSLVSSNRHLRHCGKKLPRYCDVNKDRKISITEWLNCLGVNTKTKTTIVRTGLNPLEHILKSD